MKITDFTKLKNNSEIIEEFQGEYRWLSNFVPAVIVLDGITYPSVENAYVSAKRGTHQWKLECANPELTSPEAKKKGYGLHVENKIDVMTECLIQKYNQEPYKTQLIETGSKYIQEGNRWNDTFWGYCLKTNQGENNLGKIIMSIRDELQKQALSNDQQEN